MTYLSGMSENFVLYERALDGFDQVLRAVPDDQWESQSPCTEWKAVDVAGHVIGVQLMLTSGLAEESMRAPSGTYREVAGDDPVSNWASARAGLEEAAAADGVMAKVLATPFGKMPADDFFGIIVLDALTHTWDLAQATGQDVQLDPELVTLCSERIRPLDQALRGSGFFKPATTPPPGASEQEQLMAFLGREVHA